MNRYILGRGKNPARLLRSPYFLKAKIQCAFCGKATHDLTTHMRIVHGIGL